MQNNSFLKKLMRYFDSNLLMFFPLILIGITIPLCLYKGTYDFGLNIMHQIVLQTESTEL